MLTVLIVVLVTIYIIRGEILTAEGVRDDSFAVSRESRKRELTTVDQTPSSRPVFEYIRHPTRRPQRISSSIAPLIGSNQRSRSPARSGVKGGFDPHDGRCPKHCRDIYLYI